MRQRIARVRLQLVCDAQVKLLLERFDKDGNGQLDVHEFIGFYAEVKAMYKPTRFFSSNAQGDVTSQNLWLQNCRHFAGLTRHYVWS